MKHIKYLIITMICLISMTGCDTVLNTLDAGAEEFSEKSEASLNQTADVLETINYLMNNYSNGLAETSSKKLSSDEFEELGIQRTDVDGTAANYDELYEVIYQALDKTQEEINIQVPETEADVLCNEIPTVIQSISDTEMSCLIAWEEYCYSYTTDGSGSAVLQIQMTYSLEPEKINEMKEIQKEKVQEVVNELNLNQLSTIDKITTVNQFLCDTIVYPDAEPYSPESHTIYGALVDRIAVCEGYARSAQAIFEACDVESIYVEGATLDGGGHGWNLVNVDGQWYQYDATWCDGASGDYTEYLLVTDDFMKLSRTWDEAKYPASATTAYQ